MTENDTHATTEELLEAVFSVRSVPSLYNKGQLPLEVSLETAVKRIGDRSEIGDSQRGREAVNTEVEGPTALEAVTRQRLAKTQQTEKT
jgi:hypothetical protein